MALVSLRGTRLARWGAAWGAMAAVNCMSADTELTSGRNSLPDSHPVIEFRHAGYKLPNGRELLRDLNLVVQRGETLVLLGRSGAG